MKNRIILTKELRTKYFVHDREQRYHVRIIEGDRLNIFKEWLAELEVVDALPFNLEDIGAVIEFVQFSREFQEESEEGNGVILLKDGDKYLYGMPLSTGAPFVLDGKPVR